MPGGGPGGSSQRGRAPPSRSPRHSAPRCSPASRQPPSSASRSLKVARGSASSCRQGRRGRSSTGSMPKPSRAFSTLEIRDQFAQQALTIVLGTPEETANFVTAESKRWGDVIRRATIRMEGRRGSRHGKIKIAAGEGFVAEREGPPLLVVGRKAPPPHRRREQRTVRLRFGADAPVGRPRFRTEEIEPRAHVDLDSPEADAPHQREIDRRAARVAGALGDVAQAEQIALV